MRYLSYIGVLVFGVALGYFVTLWFSGEEVEDYILDSHRTETRNYLSIFKYAKSGDIEAIINITNRLLDSRVSVLKTARNFSEEDKGLIRSVENRNNP